MCNEILQTCTRQNAWRQEGEFVCELTSHGDPPGHQVWSKDLGGEHWIGDKAVHNKRQTTNEHFIFSKKNFFIPGN